MSGESERLLIGIGNSIAVTLPKRWLKEKGLKKGDTLKLLLNDAILIELPKSEEQIHKEIKEYEKTIKNKQPSG